MGSPGSSRPWRLWAGSALAEFALELTALPGLYSSHSKSGAGVGGSYRDVPLNRRGWIFWYSIISPSGRMSSCMASESRHPASLSVMSEYGL